MFFKEKQKKQEIERKKELEKSMAFGKLLSKENFPSTSVTNINVA